MGVFKCALCGTECRGRRWTVKGGKKICAECSKKLDKEWKYSEWSKMSISRIKTFFDEKELIASHGTCSFCGGRIDPDSANNMVLSDKSVICGSCVESMRLAKPVFVTVEHGPGYEYKEAADDPMPELTLQDVPWVQKEAAEERERRIEKYGSHKAVFVVDDVTKYQKADDAHQIYGRVVLGRIDKGDTLRVRRREGEYRKVVDWIDPQEFNKKARYLSEGYDGNLMVQGDVSFIYPGDVLTVEKV